MAESYSKFTSKSIWLTIAMFCLRCFLSGTKIIAEFSIYDLYGYAGEAIAFSAFVMLVYEKWLWRYGNYEHGDL